MRALITGINGFVGGHLAEALLADGEYEVWGLARSPAPALAHLRQQVRMVRADLSDAAQTLQALDAVRPQLIFHLAGQPFVPESFRDPAATLQTNILALLNIFLALIERAHQARVLVVGTNEEYGQIDPADLPLNEDAPLRPTSPYGVSKVAQGMLALQYHLSHKLDVVRVRPFTHIGPRQNERFVTASIARQIARIEAGLQPPLLNVGNLAARRDFTDVRDIVRAYLLAARLGAAGALYNVGSGRAVAISSALEELISMSSATIEVRIDPQLLRPIDIPLVVCDPTRLRVQTGWQAAIPLEQTLHDILEYWRTQTR